MDRAVLEMDWLNARSVEKLAFIGFGIGLVALNYIQLKKIGALESRIGALESRIGALESRVGTLESRIGALESRVGTLESRVGTLESRVNGLDHKVQRIDDRVQLMYRELHPLMPHAVVQGA